MIFRKLDNSATNCKEREKLEKAASESGKEGIRVTTAM
jgi:hypothetical protein